MARPIRIEYEDAVYHVMARGNERKAIFRDDDDRSRFLETLCEACQRFGLIVHVYCLMGNHYHLVVQTPRANLSQALGWLQTTYTIRFNRRHRRSGHLFQGRFKSQVVEADSYGRSLIVYIHLNPVRPGDKRRAVSPERRQDLDRYRWSSHLAYSGRVRDKHLPEWLCLNWLWYFGRRKGEAQRSYRDAMAESFGKRVSNPFQDLRAGLVLGGQTLWDRIESLIQQSDGSEEIRWVVRAGQDRCQQLVEELLKEEPDQRLQIWARVHLGGQRPVDVAGQYGYGDGSGVHQVVKRLKTRSLEDAALARRMRGLERQMKRVLSGVKS